jgi:hypothetical protein
LIMAIPLWRQYSRLTPEQRREILERRRRRLDEASTREEIVEAFEQDAREVRDAYRERSGGAAPDADGPDAPADAGSGFVSPAMAATAERLGIRPDQVTDARNRIAAVLEQEHNRRQQTAPSSLRRPFTRPTDAALDDELARRFNR